MFSISAINDTDSKGKWEPLAPTKEAQEFLLSQTYHDGLLKLQAKEYIKAQELLETVLKDPLILSAQVDNTASDGHLLQLRFLALKNLATVFLEQGPAYFENALGCYLQAVEIDSKDSVVWNKLGTLSCSMGLLSISRWAFEQGLSCSPNNWNCMEKLLEVLIAIGDEVASLSVAELILRDWPSHSRALHIKNTIKDTESIPFAPKGIDKLEPKHAKLKFPEKRNAEDDNLDKEKTFKKVKQNIELQLAEVSWTGIAGAVLGVLMPPSRSGSGAEAHRSADIRLNISLPQSSENDLKLVERKGSSNLDAGYISVNDNSEKGSVSREKEPTTFEEQPQERRSSRLERLRNRKPGKEELEFARSKDLVKVVLQFLEPFVVERLETKVFNYVAEHSFANIDVLTNPLDAEVGDLTSFVMQSSNNYGAYHMGHLLLEEVATKGIFYHDDFDRFLELEKLTRDWGKDRSPECSLFLAELYYEFGSHYSDMSRFMLDVAYHLCKIIETVALNYPFHVCGDNNCFSIDGPQGNCHSSVGTCPLLGKNRSFWVRFYWLSGQLSIFDGNKAKAQEQLYFSLSLLSSPGNTDNSAVSVSLPHCRFIKELTRDAVLHEINLIDIDLLLKRTVPNMIVKDMHLGCINLLAPLLFEAKDTNLDVFHFPGKEGEGFISVELPALDILIQACEKTKPIDVKVYLNSRLRRLRILMAAAGVDDWVASSKRSHKRSGLKTSESKEVTSKPWNQLVLEEVKAISQNATQLKNIIFACDESDGLIDMMRIIGEIQSLLVAIMCNIANKNFSKKHASLGTSDRNEERQKCCFIDAAIAFCKLQHLNPCILIKAQVELITAIHDMLAEYGICCAPGDGEEEGTFLKFAIKHLLVLDMKLKSNLHPLNKEQETSQPDDHPSHKKHTKGPWKICYDTNLKISESKLDILHADVHPTYTDETSPLEKDPVEGFDSNICSSLGIRKNDQNGVDCNKLAVERPNGLSCGGEKASNHLPALENDLTVDEREELELSIDNALDQCFFCLYGLNLRCDSSYEDDLALHRNTSRGDYQTKEQCADVFQYILPYAKGSSKTGLIKLRRVLRTIRKHFPQPPDQILSVNAIDKFLDDPDLCEDTLLEKAGSDGFLDSIMKIVSNMGNLMQQKVSSYGSSEPYLEVFCNLYYYLAQSEEMNATDKWAGFVLTKEGEEFVEQNANLFKYDLVYNPLRFESWQHLANIYDEEVDLLLNDGSKQINVEGWRRNATLPQRVETSRRRSRRCLLMTLALANTAIQQGEIHELLALVYYDGIQNVVPFYDQRSLVPTRDSVWMMFCQNSMRHFKKAFAHKKDWSYAHYLGKLCEKLGYSHEISFSYYDEAITLNPSAVDPFYRMHASRLKLLCKCGKQNKEALKVVSVYSFEQSTKETAMNIFERTSAAIPDLSIDVETVSADTDYDDRMQSDALRLEEVWHILYRDCLSALEICVEGDLKHFHKARYMLAQGLHRRGEKGDVEKAKEELSFCFKSSRSSFTFNMWEIDGLVKKGRRKTPGVSGNRKVLEVNLPESSRKFITCIRKYMLFYLKLLEVTGDIHTLDRAYISIRTDKRFNLCLEDLVPVALGRYVNALILSIRQADMSHGAASISIEYLLEKLFSLYLEQMNLWSYLCSLPEIKNPELTENSLYGYLYQYIQLLEINVKLETLEVINEKLRKRIKNSKLSDSNCSKVYKHVSFAWCRTLVISMATITPLHTRISSEINDSSFSDGHENAQLLCVDLQTDELWNLSMEDPNHLKNLEVKWNSTVSKIKNVIIKRASDEDIDAAALLLRSSYNFYKDTSCTLLPSGINLYMVPSQLAAETYIQPGIDGVDILDMSTPRKLLLWAYTLLHGYCASISAVVKYCEENAKLKIRKGTGSLSTSSISSPTTVPTHTGDCKDGTGRFNEPQASPISNTVVTTWLPEPENAHERASTFTAQSENLCSQTSVSLPETGPHNLPSTYSPDNRRIHEPSLTFTIDGQKDSTVQNPFHFPSTVIDRSAED